MVLLPLKLTALVYLRKLIALLRVQHSTVLYCVGIDDEEIQSLNLGLFARLREFNYPAERAGL